MCHETFQLEHTLNTSLTLLQSVVVKEEQKKHQATKVPSTCSTVVKVRASQTIPLLRAYCIQERIRARGQERRRLQPEWHLALFVRAEEPCHHHFLLQGDDEVECLRIAAANTNTREAANTRNKLLRARVLRHAALECRPVYF
jgi:hypothetical protein